MQVTGASKCGKYEPGDTDLGSNDHWNAVYVKNKWELIHPFWVCVSLVGSQAGGWMKLEQTGKKGDRKTTKEIKGTLINAFKEYYFMPKPQEIMYCCNPDDTKWQLTEKKISRADFIKLPYLFPTFFGLGLKLVSENNCRLVASKGEVEIDLQTPIKNANEIEFHYVLWYKKGPKKIHGEDMLEKDNIPRLVAMIRFGENWKFQIKCPVEGTYKLCLYGGHFEKPLRRVADFRIDCKKRKQDCTLLPFDPGRLGFGPGKKAENAGLFMPSHLNGLVPAKVDNDINISFKVEAVLVKSMYVKVELLNDEAVVSVQERTVLKKQVTWRINNHELFITTCVQKEGEYSLAIYTGTKPKGREEDEDVSDSDVEDLQNVCNYKVSTYVKSLEVCVVSFCA